MGRTRIKICGLTRQADVAAAGEVGADAIGLVFYASSPRAVEAEQACALLAALPPFVTSVGLFVNAEPELVRSVLARAALDVLQFHGAEPPDYCNAFQRPWIKAIRMRPGLELGSEARRYSGGRGLLLDTYEAGLAGGTGRSFDWGLVPAELASSIILAGGLTPRNVAEAVRRVRPFAVDVSGGVEVAKGVKERDKMLAFVEGVRDGDESQ